MSNETPIISYSNAFITEKVIERIMHNKAILENKISLLVNEFLKENPGIIIDSINIHPAGYGVECGIGLKL